MSFWNILKSKQAKGVTESTPSSEQYLISSNYPQQTIGSFVLSLSPKELLIMRRGFLEGIAHMDLHLRGFLMGLSTMNEKLAYEVMPTLLFTLCDQIDYATADFAEVLGEVVQTYADSTNANLPLAEAFNLAMVKIHGGKRRAPLSTDHLLRPGALELEWLASARGEEKSV